jgi:2-polyprenyl-3-methyl-5-hydroxy-6-metoxy-1,4-benzoquinol methylase
MNEEEIWNQHYDRSGGVCKSPFLEPVRAKVQELIPADVETILDAGCGGGALLKRLSDLGKYHVVGVDQSHQAVKVATSELKLNATVGSILNMEQFEDNTFDLVICSAVTEHMKLPEVHQCVKELKRVAKKYVITTNPYKEYLDYCHVVCDSCTSRFNLSGHLNSVDEEFVKKTLGKSAKKMEFHYVGKRDWQSRFFADLMRFSGYVMASDPGITCPNCDKVVVFKKWSILARLAGYHYRIIQILLSKLGFSRDAQIISILEL